MTCKTLGILYLYIGGHHTACWQQ